MEGLSAYGSDSSDDDKNTTKNSFSRGHDHDDDNDRDMKCVVAGIKRPAPRSVASNHDGPKSTSNMEAAKQQQQEDEAMISILSEDEAKARRVFVRNDPHVRGNWACLVYLNLEEGCYSSNDDDDELRPSNKSDDSNETVLALPDWKQRQEQACAKLAALLKKETCMIRNTTNQSSLAKPSKKTKKTTTAKLLVRHAALHLSLTRTFYLQAAFLESFIQGLRRRIASQTPFYLHLDTNRMLHLENDSGTRQFWAWPVVSVVDQQNLHLSRLVAALDDLLVRQYQQAAYYHPPIFHATILSSPLQSQQQQQQEARDRNMCGSGSNGKVHLFSMTEANDNKVEQQQEPMTFLVTKVYCRLGDQIHSFPLVGEDGQQQT